MKNKYPKRMLPKVIKPRQRQRQLGVAATEMGRQAFQPTCGWGALRDWTVWELVKSGPRA